MKTYKITWSIEISADSPEEAAKEALDSIINGCAKVFEVSEEPITIDLCSPE